MQSNFGKFTRPVSGHDFEKLEHEAFAIELANEGASALLTQKHVFSHQFVYSATNRPHRNLKAKGQIFFIGQRGPRRRKTGLDVVDQLPFDLAIKHSKDLPKEQTSKPKPEGSDLSQGCLDGWPAAFISCPRNFQGLNFAQDS